MRFYMLKEILKMYSIFWCDTAFGRRKFSNYKQHFNNFLTLGWFYAFIFKYRTVSLKLIVNKTISVSKTARCKDWVL